MYNLITYEWEYENTQSEIEKQTSMMAWGGDVVSWVLYALKQPENWKLINQVKIDEGQYNVLKEKLNPDD